MRQAVQDLGAQAVQQRTEKMPASHDRLHPDLQEAVVPPKVADSTGCELTGGSLLMRTLILRRLLRREVLARRKNGRRPAAPYRAGVGGQCRAEPGPARGGQPELHGVAGRDADCIDQAGIRHVLTSRGAGKLGFQLEADWSCWRTFATR